jgi:hypothetical protein
MPTKFWFKNLKGRDHSEELVVDGKIMLKWLLRELNMTVWTGFTCPRIRAREGLL